MKLDGLTNKQLVTLRELIESKPENQQTGLFKYTATARKKLDAIDRQITYNLRQAKLARGEYINDAGYSGRQTKKR